MGYFSAALAVSLLCLNGALSAFAQAEPPLKVLYYERHPFHYKDAEGKIVGLVGTPATQAFRKAGIAISWELVPASRILAVIKSNAEAICSPGWFKDPVRDAYARFTVPLYKSLPPVGLVRAESPIRQGVAAKDLLEDPKTRLIVKQSLSYGDYLDGLIAKMPRQQVEIVTAEYVNMVKMIKGGHADLMIETAEQVEMTIREAGFKSDDFHLLKFPDVTARNDRYIMCSRQVPAELIARLNEAIRSAPAGERRPKG
jgi:polar amino acid transport system substrate-binding protein